MGKVRGLRCVGVKCQGSVMGQGHGGAVVEIVASFAGWQNDVKGTDDAQIGNERADHDGAIEGEGGLGLRFDV